MQKPEEAVDPAMPEVEIARDHPDARLSAGEISKADGILRRPKRLREASKNPPQTPRGEVSRFWRIVAMPVSGVLRTSLFGKDYVAGQGRRSITHHDVTLQIVTLDNQLAFLTLFVP